MHTRLANATDVPELAQLFRQTVLRHGAKHYTSEQVRAWAAFGADKPEFRSFILEATTFVAVDNRDSHKILGFAGIANNGHVASIYVHHDCLRQGIGFALMQELLAYAKTHGIPRLYAEASLFSLGLFKKFGFQVYDTEVVTRQDIAFERYLVERYQS